MKNLSFIAVVTAMVLLSSTSEAALRTYSQTDIRSATTSTPIEHQGVPPMQVSESRVEGYYPLRYLSNLLEIKISASLAKPSVHGDFVILFPLSTARASDEDFAEQVDKLSMALARFNLGISGNWESPVPRDADKLAELMGARTLTEFLAAELSALAVERALGQLGENLVRDGGSSDAYLSLSRRFQPALRSALKAYTAEERDELAVTSIWSAIPRSFYYQLTERDKLYFRGIDGYLFALPFTREYENEGMDRISAFSAQRLMSIVLPSSLQRYMGPQQAFWTIKFKLRTPDGNGQIATDLFLPEGLEILYTMKVEGDDGSYIRATFRPSDTLAAVGTLTSVADWLKFKGDRYSY